MHKLRNRTVVYVIVCCMHFHANRIVDCFTVERISVIFAIARICSPK